jgi:hypothetical protein
MNDVPLQITTRSDAVHLILGHPQDLCCLSVRTALEARNCPTRIIANPMVHPSRLAWRLDNEQSATQLVWDDGPPVLDHEITGVLVRSMGWVDSIGWQPADLAYIQAETQAALLAWLWSLACPVINRYPSAVWYRPQFPLLCWQALLRRCGLPSLETLVTNVRQEARAFGQRLAKEGIAGAVYGPLTSDVRYLVTSEEDWTGLAAMQRRAPVCLTYPHGAAQLVCVVGERAVWEGAPSRETGIFEPALRRFAKASGLLFVELAFAPTSDGTCVVAVEPYPHLERFGEAARQQIVEGLVHLLTDNVGSSREPAAQVVEKSLL